MKLRHPFFIEESPDSKWYAKWWVMYGWSCACRLPTIWMAYIALGFLAVYFVLLRKIKYGDPIWEK